MSQENREIRSGRLFRGSQESPEFLGFQGSHRHLEAQASQEFLGCPVFRHQEPLRPSRTAMHSVAVYRQRMLILEDHEDRCTGITHCCPKTCLDTQSRTVRHAWRAGRPGSSRRPCSQSSYRPQILLKCMCGNTRARAAAVVKHHLEHHRRRASQVFPQSQEFQRRRLGLEDQELLVFRAHQACQHLEHLQSAGRA